MSHEILTRSSVATFPYQFAVEENAIKCSKTGRVFSMTVILHYDNEKGYYANPQGDYSYCPHCGGKLDLWEGRKHA